SGQKSHARPNASCASTADHSVIAAVHTRERSLEATADDLRRGPVFRGAPGRQNRPYGVSAIAVNHLFPVRGVYFRPVGRSRVCFKPYRIRNRKTDATIEIAIDKLRSANLTD